MGHYRFYLQREGHTFAAEVLECEGDSDAMVKAKELLADKQLDIKTISDDLGYSSVQHFNKAFSKKFGVSPGKAR